MFKFIKDAMTELEHVVWPTPNETKKYMVYTVGVIVVLATFLALLGYGIRFSLTGIRAQFPHEAIQTTVSGEDMATTADLSGLLDTIEKRKAASGASTEVKSSGATLVIDTGAIQQ